MNIQITLFRTKPERYTKKQLPIQGCLVLYSGSHLSGMLRTGGCCSRAIASLVLRPHAPPGEKWSGEPSQMFSAYLPKCDRDQQDCISELLHIASLTLVS